MPGVYLLTERGENGVWRPWRTKHFPPVPLSDLDSYQPHREASTWAQYKWPMSSPAGLGRTPVCSGRHPLPRLLFHSSITLCFSFVHGSVFQGRTLHSSLSQDSASSSLHYILQTPQVRPFLGLFGPGPSTWRKPYLHTLCSASGTPALEFQGAESLR